jgi:hypothetical protein
MSDPEVPDWAAWKAEAARLRRERNIAWQERFDLVGRNYSWYLASGTIRWERDEDVVVAEALHVGHASKSAGTLLWSWANADVPPEQRKIVDRVRKFGLENGIPSLTTPEFKGGIAEGREMLDVAARVLDAEGVFVSEGARWFAFLALFRFEVRPKSEETRQKVEHVTLPALDEAREKVVSWEVLEVVRDAAGLVRLLHSPALVDGIASSDLLELDPSALCGFRVILRGGMVAVVFVLPSVDLRARAQSEMSKEIRTLGGLCDGGPDFTLVFSVPVTAGFPAIERFFADARARFRGSEWWFGNVYDADGKPLEWW